MQSRFAAGSNPSWAEWRQWAEQCGFTALNLTPNQLGIYQFLSRYGAIIYSGTWGYTFDGHVVIITGVNTDTNTVYIDDPLETLAPVSKNMNVYFGQLIQSLWENPLFVYSG
jgi:papain like cysteine protease AvrRpt2